LRKIRKIFFFTILEISYQNSNRNDLSGLSKFLEDLKKNKERKGKKKIFLSKNFLDFLKKNDSKKFFSQKNQKDSKGERMIDITLFNSLKVR